MRTRRYSKQLTCTAQTCQSIFTIFLLLYTIRLCDLFPNTTFMNKEVWCMTLPLLTTRKTDFFDDSCSSPDIISSSKIYANSWEAHGGRKARYTYGVGFLEVEDAIMKLAVPSCLMFRMLLTDRARKPGLPLSVWPSKLWRSTHVSKVSVKYLHISVYNFERDQLVVPGPNAANEEQGCVASVYHFSI